MAYSPENSGPYDKIIPELLKAIAECLKNIYLECKTLDQVTQYAPEKINEKFSFLTEVYRDKKNKGLSLVKDTHLFRKSGKDRKTLRVLNGKVQSSRTRISDLIVGEVFNLGEKFGFEPDQEHFYFPHPLKIALKFLTIPEEPASSEYVYFSLRNYIFNQHHAWPEKFVLSDKKSKLRNVITFMDVSNALQNMITHKRHSYDAFDAPVGAKKGAIYSLLCLENILQVRTKKSSSKNNNLQYLIEYLDDWQLPPKVNAEDKPVKSTIEYRVSPRIDRMPGTSYICNRLWGIPLPIRGADTVFSGGLQTSNDGGLVIGTSGGPGTGKTSMALSFGALLAPMGTKTLYITAEESPGDLKSRLNGLIPVYFRKSTFFNNDLNSWFFPRKLPSHTNGKSGTGAIKTILKEVKQIKKAAEKKLSSDQLDFIRVKSQAPLLVVLDGIHSYFDKVSESESSNDYSVEMLVEECRKLNTIVILTSAEARKNLDTIDYLVDVVIKLIYSDTDVATQKPYRTFSLEKTRHQLSRPGAHLLHLSGKKGFRLSPQLTSQIDRRTAYRQQLPQTSIENGEKLYDPFNQVKHQKIRNDFVCTFPRSHIILHGSGSTGKAGLGLKVLSSPMLQKFDQGVKLVKHYRPRVYVLSFLYGKEYYEKLLSEITRSLRKELSESYPGFTSDWYTSHKPVISVNHCHPGFLKPEDLYVKINDELNRAENEGLPYNGVLLDGLHNVFMQFPLLEESTTIWPMLYSMFRTRENLNVLTTHTTISVGKHASDDSFTYRLKQDMPFLLALVQSSDFYLELNEVTTDHMDKYAKLLLQIISKRDGKEKYILEAKSSIGQEVPTGAMLWDKNKYSLNYIGLPETPKSEHRPTDQRSLL